VSRHPHTSAVPARRNRPGPHCNTHLTYRQVAEESHEGGTPLKHIARTLSAAAGIAAVAIIGAPGAHAASNVTANIDCAGIVTYNVSHVEWGQQVTITIDGGAHVHDRPGGWWDGDGPHGDWTASGAVTTDGDVNVTWTDWEGGNTPHGPIRLTIPGSCTTTIPATTTTVAAATSTPDTTIAPEPSTTTPATTTSTPDDTTTSSTPAATAPSSVPVQVTEPTVWLGTAPRPPAAPEAPQPTVLRPTPPVAAVTTIQTATTTTTTNDAPNNHTCDNAQPPCETATGRPADELARTGTGDWLIALVGYGLLILAIGAACRRLQTRPRTIR
jgi:hypothetical protein